VWFNLSALATSGICLSVSRALRALLKRLKCQLPANRKYLFRCVISKNSRAFNRKELQSIKLKLTPINKQDIFGGQSKPVAGAFK
jgi:hypothetical protein